VGRDLQLSAFRFHLLARTLLYNGAVALLATAMGLPAALVLGRGRGRLSKVLWAILPAALLMPSLAYAYGWSQFVRLLRPVFEQMSITFVPAGPADVARCVWSLAAWLWPVPAGLIGLALRRMDTGVQQQAILDGALLRVTVRQLLSPIIASCAIVTLLATQEFSVYEPTGISVVATEVRMVFETGAFSSLGNPIVSAVAGSGLAAPDQPARAAAAVATAIPLLLITCLLAGLAMWFALRTEGGESVTTGPWPRALNAPRWASALALLLVLITVGIPVLSLFLSLKVPFSPLNIWEEFKPQLVGSISVAACALVLTIVVAFSAAGRWTTGLLALAGACFLIGGQLLAISLIRIYDRPSLMWAYNGITLPIIAYAARFGWLPLAAARGTWTDSWRELREMAALDGAGPLRTAAYVVWPLAWPSLLAGCLLVGALSLTEVPATVLLSPQNPQVLTPMLMTWVHMVRYDSMIEASLAMMALVLIPAIVAVALFSYGSRAAARLQERYANPR
jgi:iron(III) transport system permease protein